MSVRRLIRQGCSAVLLLLVGSGCGTFEWPEERDARLQHEQYMDGTVGQLAQNSARQAREVAALRADVQALVDERQQIAAQLASALRQIRELQDRLALAEKQLSTVDADYRRRLQDLQKALADEGEAREKSLKEVITSVSREISQTASQLKAEQNRIIKSLNEAAAAGQSEYVVQRGDTLGAIAKAFGVSVESLMKANGLGKPLIREGQRLVIPGK